jgi:NAD(P)-dependent dehydrogenase (short-subunit alcohol dehydrogenase family)
LSERHADAAEHAIVRRVSVPLPFLITQKKDCMGLTLTGFDNKVAVVTGAGRMRSIGRPIALVLAKAGCDIVLTGTGKSPALYPDAERAAGWRDIESVADEIRALGRRALPLVSDVSSPEAVEALADRVLAELGRVDFLVNNAGSTRGQDRQLMLSLPVVEWQRVIDTRRLDAMGRGDAWDGLVKAFIPLGRAGTGEDIAHMVAFLCSEQGAWISGQNIYVDGGHTNVPQMAG